MKLIICFSFLTALILSSSAYAISLPKKPERVKEIDCQQAPDTVDVGKYTYKVICSAEDLANIVLAPTDGDALAESLSRNYILGKDLDLAEYSKNEVVIGWGLYEGADEFPFTGRFHGNAHSLKNFSLDADDRYFVALFGEIKNAVVSDLYIEGFNVVGKAYTGSLVGKSVTSRIERIVVKDSYVRGHRVQGLVVGANMLEPRDERQSDKEAFEELNPSLEGANFYGIKDVTAFGVVDGYGNHTGGITGFNMLGVLRTRVVVAFDSSYAAQGRVIGWNYSRSLVKDNSFFPGEVEYLTGVEVVDTEVTLDVFQMGHADRFNPCGNDFANRKVGYACAPESNQLMEREEAQAFLRDFGMTQVLSPRPVEEEGSFFDYVKDALF